MTNVGNNNEYVALGLDPNGEAVPVTSVSGSVIGTGATYPVSSDEEAKRDENGKPCILVRSNGKTINLRLNNERQIVSI